MAAHRVHIPARRAPRVAARKDLLAAAHGSEIDWDEAAWMLRDRSAGDAPFVYFIGEQPNGAIKIGEAADPIKRLRALQTGNPRRLKIERLIFGDRRTEALIHEYFRAFVIESSKHRRSEVNARYAVETEWFSAEGRERILAAASEIAFRQRTDDERDTLEDMERIVGEVMAELGYEIDRQQPVTLLGRDIGYVERKLHA